MWFQVSKQRLFLLALTSLLASGFGCSPGSSDNTAKNTEVGRRPALEQAKQEQVEVDIVLKDKREIAEQAISQAPTPDVIASPTITSQAPYIGAGIGGAGGLIDGFAGGFDVPFAPWFGPDIGPWFGPGLPFPIIVRSHDDDDGRGRRHRHRDRRDDDVVVSDDDNCTRSDDNNCPVDDDGAPIR